MNRIQTFLRWSCRYDPEKPCADEDALARAGARDCVAAMLRKLGNEEAEQNRLNRVERRRVQRALIRDQIAAATSSVRDDVCWNFVKREFFALHSHTFPLFLLIVDIGAVTFDNLFYIRKHRLNDLIMSFCHVIA